MEKLLTVSNMNTKLLVTILIVLLIIAIGVYYMFNMQTGRGVAQTSTTTTTPATTTKTTTTPATTTTSIQTVWKPDGEISPGEYTGHEVFGNGVFEVYWRVENDTLYMAIKGKTKGWVAIGFEPSRGMADADMVFGWVYDNGTVVVLDQYSIGVTGPHKSDTELGGQYNILKYGGKESNGYTIIEFSRLLNTGDKYDKDLSSLGQIKIIWAIGPTDNPTAIHTARGSGTITL